MLAVPPTHRRAASAVRHFPPGCGRPGNAAAGKPPRPLPPSTTKPPLLVPTLRSATTTAAPAPRRMVPAAASSGTAGTNNGAENGREASTAVTVRRASAMRTYPPGCGRGLPVPVPVAVAMPPALVVEGEDEAGASKQLAELCIEAKAKVCDREPVLCECAIDDGEFISDG
jgi:hypothetical protein